MRNWSKALAMALVLSIPSLALAQTDGLADTVPFAGWALIAVWIFAIWRLLGGSWFFGQ